MSKAKAISFALLIKLAGATLIFGQSTPTVWPNHHFDDGWTRFYPFGPQVPTDFADYSRTVVIGSSAQWVIAGNIVGDSSPEIITLGGNTIQAFSLGGVPLWTTTLSGNQLLDLTLINPYGADRWLVSCGRQIIGGHAEVVVFDSSGAVTRTFTFTSGVNGVAWPVKVADFNGDAVPDFLTATVGSFERGYILFDYASGSRIWYSPYSSSFGPGPLGNVDGDPSWEVTSYDGIGSPTTRVTDCASGTASDIFTISGSGDFHHAITDLSVSGLQKIIVLYGSVSLSPTDACRIAVLDSLGNTIVSWQGAPDRYIDAYGYTSADITGDSRRELVICEFDHSSNTAFVLRVFDDSLHQIAFNDTLVNIAGNAVKLYASDINGDGKAEILVTDRASGKLRVLDSTLNEIWSFDAPGVSQVAMVKTPIDISPQIILLGDSLTVFSQPQSIPSTLRIGQGTECLTSLSPSQLVLPLYLENPDTVKAGDIPLCYDWPADPDSVSFVGTRLEPMDFKTDSIDAANNSVRVLFVADFGGSGNVLPPVDGFSQNVPIAKIYFHLPYECNETWIQAPDTCSVLLAADVISLELVNKFDQPYMPLVLKDSTRVLQYRPGDCDMNQIITISDAVCIISYIFSGGQPGCINASDADCNGIVTISDVVYIINYIFAGGPVPGANCLCGPAPMIAKSTVGVANVGTTNSALDNRNLIEVNLDASAAVRAVQLDFTATGEVHDIKVMSSIGELQLFSGTIGSEYRVGLIDLTGTAAIPAGSSKVAVVSYEGTGELSIASATVVDNDAAEMTVTIGNTKLESNLPLHYELAQNQPNPFNPSTEISFSLPKADRVRLVVYNILGEEIAILVDEAKAAGVHRVTWDGKDKSGRAVASGVYFYKLLASDFSQSRKMLLLK